MCKPAFSHAPSVPSQKFLTHARKTFLKIPRENTAWPGTSVHACAGSVLLAQLCSHQVYAGETSSRSRKVSGLVPAPQAGGQPGRRRSCSLLWGIPLQKVPHLNPRADQGGSMCLHIQLMPPWGLLPGSLSLSRA